MRRIGSSRALFALLVAVQGLCAAFFVYDILTSVLGFGGPIPWRLRELVEIGAAFGLVAGLILGAFALRNALRRSRRAEERLRDASTAFAELIESRFDAWVLTPAERDVALFSIKGFSPAEIAELRKTSVGTVKAQSAAVYRKAGVSSRAELLSGLIEHLMDAGPAAPVKGVEEDPAPPPPEIAEAAIGADDLTRRAAGRGAT